MRTLLALVILLLSILSIVAVAAANKKQRTHAMRSAFKSPDDKNNNNNNDEEADDDEENYKWLNFDCQVCTALCGELDRCVKDTPIDHPYSEIVDCAIANTTSNYGFDPSTNLIRRLPSTTTDKKERLRMERELTGKYQQQHQDSPSSDNNNKKPHHRHQQHHSVRERIEKSLNDHLDVYHRQVVLHAMVASGKTRHTRHSVPADICLDLLCHQHLHVCHEDDHPEAKTTEERRKELIPGVHHAPQHPSGAVIDNTDNINDDDDDDDSSGSENNNDGNNKIKILRKMAHDHDGKFSVHHDHHNLFKHHFQQFIDHFENTVGGEKRSHGHNIHPPTRRHAAFHPSAKSDMRDEERERVISFAHAGENLQPSSSSQPNGQDL